MARKRHTARDEDGLTEQRKLFVQEYLVDFNGAQAAMRAGYSPKSARYSARDLLEDPAVVAALGKAIAARAQRTQVDADYVITAIRETIERCRQTLAPVLTRRGEPVLVEDRNGELVPAYTFDAANVLKGSELLGKHLGMFKEHLEHSGSIAHRHSNELSEAELERIATSDETAKANSVN